MTTYYGKLTGKNYDSIEALRHHESREAQRRSIPTAEEAAFSNLPAEEQRRVVERMVAEDKRNAALVASRVDTDVFLQLHPEYVDCDHNSAVMNITLGALMKARGTTVAMLEDIEEAYELSRARKVPLQLNEKVLREQQRSGIEQRAAAVRQQREHQANFDKSDAYDLSIDELRQRASDQLAGVHRSASRDPIGSMGAEYGDTVPPLNASDRLDDRDRTITPGSGLSNRGWSQQKRF